MKIRAAWMVYLCDQNAPSEVSIGTIDTENLEDLVLDVYGSDEYTIEREGNKRKLVEKEDGYTIEINLDRNSYGDFAIDDGDFFIIVTLDRNDPELAVRNLEDVVQGIINSWENWQ